MNQNDTDFAENLAQRQVEAGLRPAVRRSSYHQF